jgi:ABC-type lipoprotein release transport system permease subunit
LQVAGQGVRLALARIAAEGGLAASLSGLLRILLFDKPIRCGDFIGAPAFLMAVTAVAVLLPAWKAARLDPIRALSYQ